MPNTSPTSLDTEISFLKPVETKAGLGLWLAAAAALVVLLALNLYVVSGQPGYSPARVFGRAIAVLFLPSLAVWFASRSESGKTQRAKVKAFLYTCLGLLLLAFTTMVATGSYVSLFGR